MAKKENLKEEKTYLATECDKVGEIAIQYGFTAIKPPHITAEDISKSKIFRAFDYYKDVEEKIALTRWYAEENLQTKPQPIMVFYKKPFLGSILKKKTGEESYGLEIIGSSRSTGEALIIKTTLAILSDMGYKDLYVDVNSIGDRESIAKFERDLGSYYRKHQSTLPTRVRAEFKKNHYSVLTNTSPETEVFRKGAPQTIGSLSDLSRIQFKETLEYIEIFDVPYRIKSNMLSNKLYASHSIFEIRMVDEKEGDDGKLLAYGYRYNYLAKKIGLKKDIPTVGITILVKRNPKFSKKVLIKNIKKPSFYLIQLGETAKLKALNVVETLRKNKIPVYHSITKDKITGQLVGAEYVHATHVLIIGQKEAIENSVVVRDVISRVQDTVPISELANCLKGLKK